MGLLDLFGGGDASGLTPAQQQAMAQQGLLGALGGMANSGALSYTAPFLSGKVPGGFAEGLAAAGGGMAAGQNAYANRLKTLAETGLLGAQTGQSQAQTDYLRAQAALANKAGEPAPSMYLPGATPAGPAGGAGLATAPSGSPVDDFVNRVIGAESGNDPTAKNPRSSAAGLGQFIDETWLSEIKRNFPNVANLAGSDAAILRMKTDPQYADLQRAVTKSYATENAQALSASGLPVNNTTLYAAHFLGPQGAVKLLTADPSAPIGSIVGEKAIAGNPSLKGQTAGQTVADIGARIGAGSAPGAPAASPSGPIIPPDPSIAVNSTSAPVTPGSMMPGRAPGILPSYGASPPPASAGNGILPQIASGAPPPSPAPASSPGPAMAPGGAIAGAGSQLNPAYIAWAQQQARLNAALGRTTPADIATAAGMLLVGPKAAAEKWAGVAPELYTAWNKPTDLRQGGVMVEPSTGRIIAQAPRLPEGTFLKTGPNGEPIAGEVPGAIPAIQAAAAAQHAGANQANLGPTNPMAPPGATPTAQDLPKVTPYGVLPPRTEEKLPGSAVEAEKAIPHWQERVTDWTKGIDPARQAEQRLSTIAQAFKATATGAWSTEAAALSAALKRVGVDIPDKYLNDPTAVQLALHENILTTLPLLKAATPRPTQTEFITTSENREHPNLQPQANLQMLAEDIALMRQAQNLPAAFNASGWSNPLSFETAYYARNPLPAMVEKVKSEIGPLKGMPATPSAPAAEPPQTATLNGKLHVKIGGQWYPVTGQ